MDTSDPELRELLESRSEWAAGRLVGREGRRGLGELAAAALLLGIAFGVPRLVDQPVPEWVRWAFGGFGLFGFLALLGGSWRLLGRLRFGAAILELESTPLPRGRTASATLVVPRRVHFEGPIELRLSACEIHTREGSDGESVRTETVRWQTATFVSSEDVRLEPESTRVPVRLPLPLEGSDSSPKRFGDRHLWRLEVDGRTAGPDFRTSFELPVFGAAEEPEPPAPDESPSLPARELLERARFRLVETASGLRVDQPLVPVPSMTLGCAVASVFLWGTVAVIRAAGAPWIFPLVVGALASLLSLALIDSLIGRARLRVEHGELHVAKGHFPLGLRGTLAREQVRGIEVNAGDRIGRQILFHLEAPSGAGALTGRRLVASLPDRSTAEALLGELHAAIDRAA